MPDSCRRHIAIIGFGEAGQAFAEGWRQRVDGDIIAFDIKCDDRIHGAEFISACISHAVKPAETRAEALAHADAVFSLVTADRALAAAGEIAPFLQPHAFYFDCNSCSPGTKRASQQMIGRAGGRYVDVAVMSPVRPGLHRAPLLVSGPDAEDAIRCLEALDMKPSFAGLEVGRASAIKMLRSVMIKGLEALTAECLLAARKAGVEEPVLASFQASDPGFDWTRRSAYNLERMMVHGARRAAEMREVAATLSELGLPGRMARATSDWQQDIADLGLAGGAPDLALRADSILAALMPGDGGVDGTGHPDES